MFDRVLSVRACRQVALAAIVVAGVMWSGCSKEWPATRTDVSKRSPGLILLPNAVNVNYYDTLDQDGRTELEQLSYQLDAPFPAADVICPLTAQLGDAGWRPLRDSDAEPGAPSSFVNGWRVSRTRGRSGEAIHLDQWMAEWVNAEGEFLSYALVYRYPEAEPASRGRMRVGALRTPAAVATAAERARRQGAAIVSADESARVSADVTCGAVAGSS